MFVNAQQKLKQNLVAPIDADKKKHLYGHDNTRAEI
jgi:hypothetical protein